MNRPRFLPEPQNVIRQHEAYNDVKGRVNVILEWQTDLDGYVIKLLVVQGLRSDGSRPMKIVWQPWQTIHDYIQEGKLQRMPL